MKIQAIKGPSPRTRPLVVIGMLTRNRPRYLKESLEGVRRGMKTSLCDSRLFIWNNGEKPIPEQTHGVGHNVGQHISMNRLIQEAVDLNADWFIRVDDDCVFKTRDWLAKMIRLQSLHHKKFNRYCVLSPYVHGLINTPVRMGEVEIGKYICHIVPILGGICRMMPMSLLRYWRFDERMPMGWSEASTFAKYCLQTFTPMLRCVNIEVNHGRSTDFQVAENPEWAYEHLVLQTIPYGL